MFDFRLTSLDHTRFFLPSDELWNLLPQVLDKVTRVHNMDQQTCHRGGNHTRVTTPNCCVKNFCSFRQGLMVYAYLGYLRSLQQGQVVLYQ